MLSLLLFSCRCFAQLGPRQSGLPSSSASFLERISGRASLSCQYDHCKGVTSEHVSSTQTSVGAHNDLSSVEPHAAQQILAAV